MRASAPLTLHDYWLIARRRIWLILGVVCLGVLSAAILCVVLPKSYRSSSLILVEDQKIPENYVKAIVGASIAERLTMIEQQVMSRTLLRSIIDQFRLYERRLRTQGVEAVIKEMRTNVRVETVGAQTGRQGSVEAFTISFAHEDPVVAMKVTARLANQFIEENLRVREQLVEGASDFLQQELEQARDALEQQERAITEFKSRYMGELPQQTEANLRALDRFQSNLISVNEMLQRLKSRRSRINDAIDQYLSTASVSGGAPAGASGHPGQDPLVLRYWELEHRLAALTAEYTEIYPDVIQVREEISAVKAQLASRYGQVPDALSSEPAPPLDSFLHGLIEERDEIEAEVAGLMGRQRRLTEQIHEYEGRVERAPAREQELTVLLRDHENSQANYRSLLDKKLSARVAENLEKRQKGEQFRIIDPANIPDTPERPNRARIMVVGLALGCSMGFGAAVLLERTSQTFRQPQEVERLLGAHVLAVIPDFALDERSWRERGRMMVQAAQRGTHHILSLRRKDKGGLVKRLGTDSCRNGEQTRPEPSGGTFVARWRPSSIVAEQYRVAATRLSLMTAGSSSNVVVATSSVKGEGKTTTAINLGYTLAKDLGKRTVIIDCDFNCPALHKYTGIQAEPGLADVLEGKVAVDQALRPLGDGHGWILPVGARPARAVELSKTAQVEAVVTELRARFDYVVIDAPPILPLADMNILGTLADILVVVVRAGETPQHVVVNALNTLRPSSQPLVVLNAIDAQSLPYYQYYDYRAQAVERERT